MSSLSRRERRKKATPCLLIPLSPRFTALSSPRSGGEGLSGTTNADVDVGGGIPARRGFGGSGRDTACRLSSRTFFETGDEEPAFVSAVLLVLSVVVVAVAAAGAAPPPPEPRPEGPASPSRASMDGQALKVSALTRGDEEESRLEGEQGVKKRSCIALLNAIGSS